MRSDIPIQYKYFSSRSILPVDVTITGSTIPVMWRYSTLARAQKQEPHNQMKFNVIPRKHLFCKGLPLGRRYCQCTLSLTDRTTVESKSVTDPINSVIIIINVMLPLIASAWPRPNLNMMKHKKK